MRIFLRETSFLANFLNFQRNVIFSKFFFHLLYIKIRYFKPDIIIFIFAKYCLLYIVKNTLKMLQNTNKHRGKVSLSLYNNKMSVYFIWIPRNTKKTSSYFLLLWIHTPTESIDSDRNPPWDCRIDPYPQKKNANPQHWLSSQNNVLHYTWVKCRCQNIGPTRHIYTRYPLWYPIPLPWIFAVHNGMVRKVYV